MRRILYSILLCCFAQSASAQCTPIITPQGNTTFCDGNDVTLSGSLGDTYQWYLNGNAIAGANSDTYVATTAGDYTVEIDSVGCVATSDPVTVTVNTVPAQPGLITGPAVVCEGTTYTYSIDPVPGATSYLWGGGPGWGWSPSFYNISTSLPSITAAVGGADLNSPAAYVGVRAVNVCGESAPSSLNIDAYTPVPSGGMNNDPDITYLGVTPYICPNSTNNILNAFHHGSVGGYNGPSSYQWYRNNVLMPGANGYELDVNRGGLYKVVISSGGVCHVTLEKPVIHQVAPVPTSIDVLTPQPMCEGGVTLLKVNFDMDGYDGTAFNWRWNRNDTSISWNTNYHIATLPGNYSIGLSGYGYMNNPIQCPNSPVLANVSLSGTQATPVSISQSGNDLYATAGFASYQWCRNNEPIIGATNDNFTINNWGDFSVVATDNNGCASQSNVVVGVESFLAEKDRIYVYPNPNNGEVNLSVNIPDENNIALIEVLDIAGKVLYANEQSITSGKIESQIHLENIASGLYFLKVRSGSVNSIVSFVKQ